MTDSSLVRKLTDAILASMDVMDGLDLQAAEKYAQVAAEVVHEHVEGIRAELRNELDERLMIEFIANGELSTQVSRLRTALTEALNELGVSGPGYPAPVANAVDILRAALAESPNRAEAESESSPGLVSGTFGFRHDDDRTSPREPEGTSQ